MRTTSPFFVGLRRRFGGAPSTHDGSYCSFTTAFDQVVDAGDLPCLLGNQTPDEANSFDEAVARFDKTFLGERVTIGAAGAELIRGIRHALPEELRKKTVVSFLIDHSGSMRGIRMLAALLAVDSAVDALTNAGIATEVLGFTTSSWKGGNSRRAWQWAGKPRNPGRLCDLRHVVYAAANRSAGISWQLRFALRPDLLHENIDGEALSWAASRLDAAIWDHRVICMISDGAPVDDSTLLANEDRTILVIGPAILPESGL